MAKRKEFSEFPKMVYGPGGESKVVQESDKVPSGWKDHPSKVKDADQKPPVDAKYVAELEAENAALRAKLVEQQSGDTTAPDKALEEAGVSETEGSAVSEERFRKEGIQTLRAMGVTIADDATAKKVDAELKKVGK